MKKSEFRNFIKEVVKNVILENWEPYDAETDQFGDAPRDRLQGEESDLNIPEYPQSIVKQHTFDGKQMWFVYSSSDPQALILGFGYSNKDAIDNARTTAKYIKHGGVGHVGELKEMEGNETDNVHHESREVQIAKEIIELLDAPYVWGTSQNKVNKQIKLLAKELISMHSGQPN